MNRDSAAGELDIPARLAHRRRTGEVDALWPDLPMSARRAALATIKAVIRSVVDANAPPAVLEAADLHEARVVAVAAFTAGMGPLLGWWIEEGRVEADPPVRQLLGEHLRHGRHRSALLRGHASRIARAMHQADVRPVLLKGLHTGGEFFPHPATRPAADIDMLVRPADAPRVASLLRDLGFTESRRTVFADRSEWSHSSAPTRVRSLEVDHSDNPWNVDLHRALDRWYFRGTRRSLGEAPFDTTRFTDVDGEPVRVLDQPYLTAFLAMHAAFDLASVQLIRLLELVLVIRGDIETGRLDWRELSSLFDSTATGRFAYPALALAEELAPGTVEADLLRHIGRDVTPRMRRVLDAVRRAEMGLLNQRSLDVRLAWSIGGKELAMNLSELVLPSDDGGGTVREAYARRLSIVRWRIARRFGGGGAFGAQAAPSVADER